MEKLPIVLLFLSAFVFTSCNKDLKRELALKTEQVEQLEKQLEHLQQTNTSLLDRMSDLSIVSKAGAESIKESLQSINQQYSFIQDLTTKIHEKDSINMALVMNLKRSLADINDEDVKVEIRSGRVLVSISDQLLFRSGSSRITDEAGRVLGKIASVINDHKQLDVMVEGHTDNVPINNSCMTDNWDLSVKRATSVVRVLSDDYYVDPTRLTAAGRSEFAPKADNSSTTGRSLNRRTEIVIMPKLDQFFQLLEAPPVSD